MIRKITISLVVLVSGHTASFAQSYPYQNPNLSPSERAHYLVGRLTLEEKVGLMMDESKPVNRLNVNRYELLYGSSAADKNLKKMEIELK